MRRSLTCRVPAVLDDWSMRCSTPTRMLLPSVDRIEVVELEVVGRLAVDAPPIVEAHGRQDLVTHRDGIAVTGQPTPRARHPRAELDAGRERDSSHRFVRRGVAVPRVARRRVGPERERVEEERRAELELLIEPPRLLVGVRQQGIELVAQESARRRRRQHELGIERQLRQRLCEQVGGELRQLLTERVRELATVGVAEGVGVPARLTRDQEVVGRVACVDARFGTFVVVVAGLVELRVTPPDRSRRTTSDRRSCRRRPRAGSASVRANGSPR